MHDGNKLIIMNPMITSRRWYFYFILWCPLGNYDSPWLLPTFADNINISLHIRNPSNRLSLEHSPYAILSPYIFDILFHSDYRIAGPRTTASAIRPKDALCNPPLSIKWYSTPGSAAGSALGRPCISPQTTSLACICSSLTSAPPLPIHLIISSTLSSRVECPTRTSLTQQSYVTTNSNLSSTNAVFSASRNISSLANSPIFTNPHYRSCTLRSPRPRSQGTASRSPA